MYRYLTDRNRELSLPDGAVDTLEVGGKLGGVVEGCGVAPEEGLVPGLGGEVADGPLLGIQHLQSETALQIKNYFFIFLLFLRTANNALAECCTATRINKVVFVFSVYSVFRIRKFLSLPVVDPLVRGEDPDLAPDSSIKQK
jgi:hypothetical protein